MAPCLDSHVHLTPDGTWYNTGLDASENRLLREMDAAGLDGAVLIPAPGLGDNHFISEVCRRHASRLVGFAMIDFSGGEAVASQARRAVEYLGLSGFKVHPRRQNLDPNDQRLDPLMETAAELGLPVMFCTYLGLCSVSLDKLLPLKYDSLAKRHPGTTIILAHAGVHRALDAFFVAKSNPNVFLEVSHVFAYLEGSSAWQDLVFVCRRLDRKTIFGSDFPEVAIPEYRSKVEKILSRHDDCDLQAIMGGNLASLLAQRVAG